MQAMKTPKRILSMLISLALVVTLVPVMAVPVQAETAPTTPDTAEPDYMIEDETFTTDGTAPTINTINLANGTVDTAYSETLSASGDTPVLWEVDSGTLPDGLTLTDSTGVIAGTPTTAGTSDFVVKATNDTDIATRSLSITIDAAPLNTDTISGKMIDEDTDNRVEGVIAQLKMDAGGSQSGIDVSNEAGNIDNLATKGWAWYPDGNTNPDYGSSTLVLDGIDLEADDAIALKVPAGTTIVLIGSNNISNADYNGAGNTYGISCEGALTITGDGSLTVTSGTSQDLNSYGIYTLNGNFTISGGVNLTATGGDAYISNGGIVNQNAEIIITGSTVVTTCGTSTDQGSAGLSATGNITITNSTVTAASGTVSKANAGSFGILCNGTLMLTNSTVSTIGGTSQNSIGLALAASTLILNDKDSAVTAEGQTMAVMAMSEFTGIDVKGGDSNTDSGTLTYDSMTYVKSDGVTPARYAKFTLPDDGGNTTVTLNNVTADGSGSSYTQTTKITFTFSDDITGLSAGDITLGSQATGVSLTRTAAGVYELAVNVTATGYVSYTVAKSGYDITNNTGNVQIIHAPTYSISGKITGSDTSGAGLPGASVQLQDSNGNVGSPVTTDANGDYTISGVRPAYYDISVTKSGYNTGTIDDFSVYNSDVIDMDLTLTATGGSSGITKRTTAIDLTKTVGGEDPSHNIDKLATEGWAWYPNGNADPRYEANTLVLNGIDLEATANGTANDSSRLGTAVRVPANTTIVLAAGSNNSVANTGDKYACGIIGAGALNITGTGELTAAALVRGADVHLGIYASGKITISGAAVTAKGGDSSDGLSFGIQSTIGGILINGGAKLTATAGEGKGSYGIHFRGNMTVEDSGTSVTANSGKARETNPLNGSSCGISGDIKSSISISGGTVTATGGESNSNSYGVKVSDGSISATGGTLTANSGTASSGISAAVYAKTEPSATMKDDSGNTLIYNSSSKVCCEADGTTPATKAVLTAVSNTYTSGGGSSHNNFDSGSSGSSDAYTPTPSAPKTITAQPNIPALATYTLSGQPDKNGLLTEIITEKMVLDAFDKAEAETKRQRRQSYGVSIGFENGASGVTSLTVKFEEAAIQRLKSKGMEFCEVNTGVFRFHIDKAAIASLASQTSGVLTFSAVPATKLSTAARSAIGIRPVLDLIVRDATGKAVTSYGNGTITRGIRYTPDSGEKTGNLYIIKIVDGKVRWLTESSYDDGWLIWKGNSNSVYGVGYKTPAPAFTDTKDHWAKDNIDFVASRGLLTGIGTTTFSPDTAITRGMFVTALGRLSGADVSDYKTSSFTDVPAGSDYLSYIEWAVANKIVQDIGNNQFAPDAAITRQDMAVMMQNYAKAMGCKLPVSRQKITFADNSGIGSYAKDAVTAMQQAGIITGRGNNQFAPKQSATRGEAATILRRFVELVIDEDTARGWSRNDAGQWQYINEYGKLAVNTTIDGYKVGPEGTRQ